MHLPSLVNWLSTLVPSERQTLAYLWNVAADDLETRLLDPALLHAQVARLEPLEQAALQQVLRSGGTIAVARLERDYGTIRPTTGVVAPRTLLLALQGAPSPVERLFLYGLIQRVSGEHGPLYALPQEWLELLPAPPLLDVSAALEPVAPPRQAQLGDPSWWERDLVTLLVLAYAEPLALTSAGALQRQSVVRVARRMDVVAAPTSEQRWPELALLRWMALGCGLLQDRTHTLRITSSALAWLALPPAERWTSLLDAWLDSPFDELTYVAGLRWRTAPLQRPGRAARWAVLQLLAAAPTGWHSIDALLHVLHQRNPDFAQADGSFESWQLTNAANDVFPSWGSWPLVEGALARAIICGPAHWLGLVDLAGAAEPTLARLSQWGRALLGLDPWPDMPAASLQIDATGSIDLPAAVPPLARFQLQRIAEWQATASDGSERYRLTVAALDAALDRGITAAQIHTFFQRWAQDVPPALVRQIDTWQQQRQTLIARYGTVLESADPAMLAGLAADDRLQLPPYRALSAQSWLFDAADAAALVQLLRTHDYALTPPPAASELPLSMADLQRLLAAASVCATLLRYAGAETELTPSFIERIRRALPTAERVQATLLAREIAQALNVRMTEDDNA